MERRVIKTSAIWISHGSKTRVFQSVDEVPPVLRRKLEESTSGPGASTILIADRKGREEILHSFRSTAAGVQAPPFLDQEQENPGNPDFRAESWHQFWREALLLTAASVGLLYLVWGRW
jgi:hypothetical protein